MLSIKRAVEMGLVIQRRIDGQNSAQEYEPAQ